MVGKIGIRVREEGGGLHFFEEVAVAVRTEKWSRGRGGGRYERDAHVALVTPVGLSLHFHGGGGGGGFLLPLSLYQLSVARKRSNYQLC